MLRYRASKIEEFILEQERFTGAVPIRAVLLYAHRGNGRPRGSERNLVTHSDEDMRSRKGHG
jgi:hypothetical protein